MRKEKLFKNRKYKNYKNNEVPYNSMDNFLPILTLGNKIINIIKNNYKNNYVLKNLKETEKTLQIKSYERIIWWEKLIGLFLSQIYTKIGSNLYSIIGIIIGHFLRNDLGSIFIKHIETKNPLTDATTPNSKK